MGHWNSDDCFRSWVIDFEKVPSFIPAILTGSIRGMLEGLKKLMLFRLFLFWLIIFRLYFTFFSVFSVIIFIFSLAFF